MVFRSLKWWHPCFLTPRAEPELLAQSRSVEQTGTGGTEVPGRRAQRRKAVPFAVDRDDRA